MLHGFDEGREGFIWFRHDLSEVSQGLYSSVLEGL